MYADLIGFTTSDDDFGQSQIDTVDSELLKIISKIKILISAFVKVSFAHVHGELICAFLPILTLFRPGFS